jgi:hypothetical protein
MTNFTLYNTEEPHILYFEHNIYGDDVAGRLWFEDKNLIDYDGVFTLPREIIQMLLDKGYTVGQDFY